MFEFDPAKSEANKAKHGIDFKEAQGLWDDEDRIAFPARSTHELRYAFVAMVGNKLWCAIYTKRNEINRLISVRRARRNEVKMYVQNRNNQH